MGALAVRSRRGLCTALVVDRDKERKKKQNKKKIKK